MVFNLRVFHVLPKGKLLMDQSLQLAAALTGQKPTGWERNGGVETLKALPRNCKPGISFRSW